MKNFRLYGDKPYTVVVVHGGPGALGDMGYVANRLSQEYGVIEALQTKHSITELIFELCEIIESNCEVPVVLVGHSWGAWLAYMVAAKYPELVASLVLIGSGPFKAEDARSIESTRMSRLSPEDRGELEGLFKTFYNTSDSYKSQLMSKIGGMIEKADAYSLQPIDDVEYRIDVDGDMFSEIWGQAAELRASGELLKMASEIKCKVHIIHGDYDPHPVAGVIEPLSHKIKDINSVVLERCGHYPWKETLAHDEFFRVLRDII